LFSRRKDTKQYWNMDNFEEKNIQIWKFLSEITIQIWKFLSEITIQILI